MPTLPVLYALRSLDPPTTGCASCSTARSPTMPQHAEALALLRAHPAMAQARAEVRRWADDARAVLAPLPDVAARRALEALCDAVVDRTA